MGLKDWFKPSARAEGETREISDEALGPGGSAKVAGLDFQAAVAAHQKWKARLQACVDGTSDEKLDPEVVGRDDQCVLGQWIHGQGAEEFGEEQAFIYLRKAHADFHKTAGMVLSAVYAGHKEEAAQMLGSRFSQASFRVRGLLANLFSEANG